MKTIFLSIILTFSYTSVSASDELAKFDKTSLNHSGKLPLTSKDSEEFEKMHNKMKNCKVTPNYKKNELEPTQLSEFSTEYEDDQNV